jgi:hypothetical protein
MKSLILTIIFSITLFAMESAVSIELSPQANEYLKTLSQQDQKKVTKAIKIGNKFTELYRDGGIVYDEEIEESWNKDFKPLTTLSGERITQIWADNLGVDDTNNGFKRVTCNKTYLKEIIFDKNTTTLTYETLVIGMENSLTYADQYFKGYKFIKLDNEYFRLQLSLNQTPKISDLRFLTKNSDAHTHKSFIYSMNIRMHTPYFNPDAKGLKRISNEMLQASDICKNY